MPLIHVLWLGYIDALGNQVAAAAAQLVSLAVDRIGVTQSLVLMDSGTGEIIWIQE